jgi:hypothetical protein
MSDQLELLDMTGYSVHQFATVPLSAAGMSGRAIPTMQPWPCCARTCGVKPSSATWIWSSRHDHTTHLSAVEWL